MGSLVNYRSFAIATQYCTYSTVFLRVSINQPLLRAKSTIIQMSITKTTSPMPSSILFFLHVFLTKAVVGVLDEPYSAKRAQRSSHPSLPGGRMDTVPAYNIDWRACTATPLSGESWLAYKARLKLPPLFQDGTVLCSAQPKNVPPLIFQ